MFGAFRNTALSSPETSCPQAEKKRQELKAKEEKKRKEREAKRAREEELAAEREEEKVGAFIRSARAKSTIS